MTPAAVVFDLYGTLLEIGSLETTVAKHLPDAPNFVRAWRDRQIFYAFHVSLMERYEDFDAITAHALDYVLEQYKHTVTPDVRADILHSWLSVKPYPEVCAALEAVRKLGFETAVFTNGKESSARQAIENGGLTQALDTVLTVGPAKQYKPARAVYQLVVDHYRCKPSDIVFVSSNSWDVAGSAAFGYSVVWCNRAKVPQDRIGAPPKHVISSLAELPGLIGP